MDLTPKQTQVQGVNGTMEHEFDPTTDKSTGCKWDHAFDPTTYTNTGCKWDHGFDHKYRLGVNGTMDLITHTGSKSDHGFDPKTDTSTGCKWNHGSWI